MLRLPGFPAVSSAFRQLPGAARISDSRLGEQVLDALLVPLQLRAQIRQALTDLPEFAPAFDVFPVDTGSFPRS